MKQSRNRPAWINWALFTGTMIIVFLLGLLASSITERRAESEYVYKPKVRLMEYDPRNALWGENFPREYQSYLQTADTTFRSKYLGNAPTDMLAEDPRLVILWAGYSFSKDYLAPRGHFYAVQDIRNTLRTGAPMKPDEGPMPNTCWTCKSPDVPRLMEKMGPAGFYEGKWASKGPEVVNFIGCADCHDPKTMDLRITRPALTEAFQSMGRDISQATHQEMRTLVCAQCHVEYYFDKSRKETPGIDYLTFPWKFGITADSALKYYNSYDFADFTHQLSKTRILKAQHPDYELFMTGIHAERGLACADCHMPYIKEGGQKFTSHRIVSPLAYIENTCQVCHRESEEQLRKNVFERQEKVKEIRDKLEIQLVRAHVEAKAAYDGNATEPEMEPVLKHIRNAQWYWDYTAASHGASFHSPVEVARLIGLGMDEVQNARVLLARILAKQGIGEIPYPDITTKAKAHKLIGLPADRLRKEKEEFLRVIIPRWDQSAREREEKWGVELY
jgi:nitrite reductase (cytochrome c-552)